MSVEINSRQSESDYPFERRKYRRFKTENVFIAETDSCQTIGKLLDISQGGLAFIYVPGIDMLQTGKISIIAPDGNIRFRITHYRSISDFEIAREFPFIDSGKRRRSIQFISSGNDSIVKTNEAILELIQRSAFE